MKQLCAILLLLCVLLCAVSCAEESEVPENTQNAATENAKFNLYVPVAWTSLADSGVSGARSNNSDANVTVTAYLADDVGLTPERYWNEKCYPQYTAQNAPLSDNFALMQEQCGDTTLGGRDAKRYVFVYTLDNVNYEVMQIITSKDDVIYTLTFTAKSENYGSYADTVEQIRANFTFR